MKNDGSLTSKVVSAIAPATYTATETGTGFDTQGFEFCEIVLHAGTFTGDEEMTLTVETSTASGSGYAAISGAAFTTITTSNDAAIYRGIVRLDGAERYIRCVGTNNAGTGNAVFGVVAILKNAVDSADASAVAFSV
jgi:hypothetical protein